MRGEPTTDELWTLFWKYEERACTNSSADYRLAASTMASAIAKIIASRGTK